jgi:hypothetical protein
MSIASVLNTPGSRSICGILIRYFEMSVLSTGQRPDGLFYDVCNCIKVQCFKRKIFIPPPKKNPAKNLCDRISHRLKNNRVYPRGS